MGILQGCIFPTEIIPWQRRKKPPKSENPTTTTVSAAARVLKVEAFTPVGPGGAATAGGA